MSAKTGISWTDSTWPITVGCEYASTGCTNCLDERTLVATMTGAQVPIGDLKVGDRVLGFDDELPVGVNRKWREAEVLAIWRTRKPTVDVPFFMKQTGTVLARQLGLESRAGSDPAEWPEDLRIQEFPA